MLEFLFSPIGMFLVVLVVVLIVVLVASTKGPISTEEDDEPDFPALPNNVGPIGVRYGGYTYFRGSDGYYRNNSNVLPLVCMILALNESERQEYYYSAQDLVVPALPADEQCERIDSTSDFTHAELKACVGGAGDPPTATTSTDAGAGGTGANTEEGTADSDEVQQSSSFVDPDPVSYESTDPDPVTD